MGLYLSHCNVFLSYLDQKFIQASECDKSLTYYVQNTEMTSTNMKDIALKFQIAFMRYTSSYESLGIVLFVQASG